MPLPDEIRREMGERYAESARLAERDRRRDMVRAALLCLAWSAIGIVLILWSARTRDEVWAPIAFWGGLGTGNAGVIFTLLDAYRRGERRGDW
jgi:hypothetical protein